MLSERSNTSLASILRSPTLAVIAAYVLRMALLCVAQRREIAHPEFQVLGLEEGMVALSLATGKGFFEPFRGYPALTAWLAPVYPFLWAVFFKVSRLNADAMVLLSQTLNCALAAATCWPIFSIARKLFDEKTGLAAAWTWVFLPYAILMPLEWAWDQSLAALVLALIVDVTLRIRESENALHWTGYGLLWGFAALVNPALCGLLPFFLGWLIVRRWRTHRISPQLYGRVALMFVLSVLPWMVRNYYVAYGWVFVKSNFGVELWIGNHPNSYHREIHPMNSFSERYLLIMEGEADYSRQKEQLALNYIKANPSEFLKKTWGRVLDTWSASEDSRTDGWVTSLHLNREDVWLTSGFSVMAFTGLVLAVLETGWESLPIAFCLLIFPIPYYITHTALRYRHPIDPLMAIFAVYAIVRSWRAINPPAAAGTVPIGAAS